MLPPISRYKTIKTIKNTEQQPISTMLGTRDNQDGDIIIDTGAGRNLKPTMHGLINPTPSASKIIWGDGSMARTSVQAELPGHKMTPFLVTPKVSCTLISPGSELNGKPDCYAFFDKHAFVLSGLQVFKNTQITYFRIIRPHKL